MNPPQKVYEKKKRSKGSDSSPKDSAESVPKRKKGQSASSPKPTTDSIRNQPDAISTPAPQTIPNSPTDQIQTQSTTTHNPTPTTHVEHQSETAIETIRQIVEELNEGPETEGEGGDEPYNDFKFSNRRAEKNFGKYWSKRSVIVERGMNLSHFQTEEFKLKQNFESRGWIKWAQFSGVAVVPIVQEFYANMVDTKHEDQDCIVTKVRGVHFKIYPKDVRKFFGLKEEKNPQFPIQEEEMLDKDELAKILTGKPNAEWGHKRKLAKNRLTPKYNSLHFLACSQLYPAQNTSEISYERGLLLYAIDKGLRVELGQIIWDNMAEMFKTRKGMSGLPFAGFITKYVCKKKVTSELGEQVAKPLGPITASSRERSASHKKGKEWTTAEEHLEKMNDKWDEVNVKMGQLRDDQYFIKQELQSQGKRIEAMEAKLDLLLAAANIWNPSQTSEDPSA